MKLVVTHRVTTTYKSSTNGLAERTNKVLCNILNKEAKVHKNLHNWDNQVHHAIWVYNSTFESSIGFTPFRLTYEVEWTLLIEYEIMKFHIAKQHWLGMEELQNKKLLELVQLEESQLQTWEVI